MKVTLITTVLNEEKSIVSFLESINNQTKKPDEIVIVDGKSSDKTLSVISNFKFLIVKNKIKILEKKGNRSVGRNFAVKNSTSEIIAVTDAGCILDKNWLEEIVKPFEKDKINDVVSGFYKPIFKNIFEKSLSTYTSVMEDRIDENNFLPSSRSVAFKKTVFKRVNGYPEYLNTCEDLVFDKKLKKIGAKFKFSKNAFVFWPQRGNIIDAAKQFFSYAHGDGRALYFRKTTPLLFLRYLLAVIILFLTIYLKSKIILIFLILSFIFYILWAIYKNYKYAYSSDVNLQIINDIRVFDFKKSNTGSIKSWKAFFYLPTLQIVSDLAVMSGVILGMISRMQM